MENKNVKRGRGRPKGIHTPIKYFTEEERKQSITRGKTKYMLNKEWFCDICKNGHNYTLAGKSCHNRTNKHIKNLNARIIMNKIIQLHTRKKII